MIYPPKIKKQLQEIESLEAENATLKLEQAPYHPSKIHLTINGTNIHDWLRQKKPEFL